MKKEKDKIKAKGTITELIQYKGIQGNIPSSSTVDSRTFSRLLDDDKVVASYKMYWLLAILDEVSSENVEIEFKRIIARMIVYAWYPLLQYRLSFGIFDNLKKPVYYVSDKYGFPPNYDERKLLDFLYENEDSELQKMMKDLTFHVPYRLLSPFFAEDLKNVKDSLKNRLITTLSLSSSKCLYKIVKGDGDKIILNDGWDEYLQDNYKIIKAWIYYKIVIFLQKRNPNVPAIAFKLEPPRSRNLNMATKLWNKVIEASDIKDIYTGNQFNESNYKKFGVLSIDHFIPWSFVLHDEIWNLVPTFKNINAVKSDKLLIYDNYINNFCELQYKAFSYICERKMESALEEYIDILRLENPYEYYKHGSRESFGSKLKQSISPLYQIAANQGFQIIETLF